MPKYTIIKALFWISLWGMGLGVSAWGLEQAERIPLPEVILGEKKGEALGENDFFEGTRQTFFLSPDHSESLPRVLDFHPAFQINSSGSAGDPPQFFFRGMESLQSRFFLEGISLNEPVFQSNKLWFLPTYAMGNVEVYPSVIPASFLNSGLGGAVNIKLSRPDSRLSFQTEMGSFGFLRESIQAPLIENSKLTLDYVQSNEDFPYWDNNGTPLNSADDQLKTRQNNNFRRVALLPFWEFSKKGGLHSTLFSLNGFQTKTIPGSVKKPQTHQLGEWSHLSVFKIVSPLSSNWITESSAYLRWNKEELKSLESGSRDVATSSSLGGKTSIILRDFSWESRLGTGIQLSRFATEGNSRRTRVSHVSLLEVPVGLSNAVELTPQLLVHPSFLGMFSKSDPELNQPGAFDSSWRVGLEYQALSFLNVWGFVSRVFRKPSLSERYSVQETAVGNPDLLDETAVKADLGFIWRLQPDGSRDSHQLSYTVFGTQAKNLIAYIQNSSDSFRPENISDSFWVGQEMAFHWEYDSELSFRPSLTWMNTRNRSSVIAEQGKELPLVPLWSGKLNASWHGKRWLGTYQLRYSSETFTDKANYIQREAYTVQDFSLGYQDKTAGRFELKILNVFDKKVASASNHGVQTEQYLTGGTDYPTSGRRVSFSWIYDL